MSFDAVLVGPFGFPRNLFERVEFENFRIITDISIKHRYTNPRLVMSLLMRVLKLDGMVAVTLGQEEPLFDLRVVSLMMLRAYKHVLLLWRIALCRIGSFERIS